MKHYQFLTVFCALFLALTACNKDNETASDPRDAYVGTYYVSASYTCSNCYLSYWTNTYTSTIVVTKGSNSNELYFTDDYQTNHSVTLNGNRFDFGDFNLKGGGTGTGGGSFGSNSITYNLGASYGITCSVCSEEGSGTK